MRDNGMSHCRRRLIRQGSQDSKKTSVVNTDKDTSRALDAEWQLEKVITNNAEEFDWQWILKNRGCLCGTFDFSTRKILGNMPLNIKAHSEPIIPSMGHG